MRWQTGKYLLRAITNRKLWRSVIARFLKGHSYYMKTDFIPLGVMNGGHINGVHATEHNFFTLRSPILRLSFTHPRSCFHLSRNIPKNIFSLSHQHVITYASEANKGKPIYSCKLPFSMIANYKNLMSYTPR